MAYVNSLVVAFIFEDLAVENTAEIEVEVESDIRMYLVDIQLCNHTFVVDEVRNEVNFGKDFQETQAVSLKVDEISTLRNLSIKSGEFSY